MFLPISDIRFNPVKHVEGGLVNFQEDTVKDLLQNRIKFKIKKCNKKR